MKRKAKNAPKRPGRRAVKVGDWLTRTQIAFRAKVDRATVTKYLDLPGAPEPDDRGRFSYRQTIGWMERNATTSAGSPKMREHREAIARIEAETKAFDLGVKRGEFVERTKIAPAIAAFMAALTADLQAKFERELPAKYEGKTLAERAALNASGVDFVLRRLKNGARPLTGESPAAA